MVLAYRIRRLRGGGAESRCRDAQLSQSLGSGYCVILACTWIASTQSQVCPLVLAYRSLTCLVIVRDILLKEAKTRSIINYMTKELALVGRPRSRDGFRQNRLLPWLVPSRRMRSQSLSYLPSVGNLIPGSRRHRARSSEP
jgi:hypothetical protein